MKKGLGMMENLQVSLQKDPAGEPCKNKKGEVHGSSPQEKVFLPFLELVCMSHVEQFIVIIV